MMRATTAGIVRSAPENKPGLPYMDNYPVPPPKWSDPLAGRMLRLAAGGLVPARWFEPKLPAEEERAARTGELKLEIVSHCWNYAHLLVYQLSSLVNYPPQKADVTLTVYYCPEDTRTEALLKHFGQMQVPRVTWNWRALPKQALFRRTIGRNDAALQTQADWIWFTDCDLMFRENCLDSLVDALQGRRDALVFPRTERVSPLLKDGDPLLSVDIDHPRIVDIDPGEFTESSRGRATGPLQITHGDVARACGYCNSLRYYQQPSATWCKAYEDRAFRWLLRTQGAPIDIPGVYRIRHISKGRYTGGVLNTGLRSWLRQRPFRHSKR